MRSSTSEVTMAVGMSSASASAEITRSFVVAERPMRCHIGLESVGCMRYSFRVDKEVNPFWLQPYRSTMKSL